MREALEEFLIVLAYSTKTQLAVLFGLVFFVTTMAAGHYFAAEVQIPGMYSSLADVVREKISHRYDKVAWACLISFSLLAIKCYRKDRKRIFGF